MFRWISIGSLLFVLFLSLAFALRFGGGANTLTCLAVGTLVAMVEVLMGLSVLGLLLLTNRLLIPPNATKRRKLIVRLGYVIFTVDALVSTWMIVARLHISRFDWDFALMFVPICFLIGVTRTPVLAIVAIVANWKRILVWKSRCLG